MAEEQAQEKHSRIKHHAKKVISNYWAIAAIILAVILIVTLAWPSGVSKNKAGQITTEFLSNYFQQQGVGGVVTITSINKTSGIYQMIFAVDGTPSGMVTLSNDGKYVGQMSKITPDEQDTQTSPDNTQTQTPQDLPKAAKPTVELFVMAYCPYGTQIEKGIIPVVNLLKDKIDFKLKFVYYAMHPTSGEVEENTRQYCIQKEQTSKFIPYLTCFLQAGDSASCLTQTGVNQAQLNTCYNATDKQFDITTNLNDKSLWLSGSYPKYNVNLEDNNKYQVGGSPTLIINGQDASTGRDAASLLDAICSSFTTAPAECSTQLSSAQPDPGFGATTSGTATGAATTATCG